MIKLLALILILSSCENDLTGANPSEAPTTQQKVQTVVESVKDTATTITFIVYDPGEYSTRLNLNTYLQTWIVEDDDLPDTIVADDFDNMSFYYQNDSIIKSSGISCTGSTYYTFKELELTKHIYITKKDSIL